MSRDHSTACDAARVDYALACARYDADYPAYCRACAATGGKLHPGTLTDPPDWMPCEACLGQGKCPGCGVEQDYLADGCAAGFTCACGWSEDNTRPLWECWGCEEATRDDDAAPLGLMQGRGAA